MWESEVNWQEKYISEILEINNDLHVTGIHCVQVVWVQWLYLQTMGDRRL